jgi:uncharacterized protein YjbJ (UPF0337 family)
MNINIVLGRCMQILGKVREVWGRVTHNDLSRVSGQQLVIFGQMRVAGGLAEVLLRRYSLATPRGELGRRSVSRNPTLPRLI